MDLNFCSGWGGSLGNNGIKKCIKSSVIGAGILGIGKRIIIIIFIHREGPSVGLLESKMWKYITMHGEVLDLLPDGVFSRVGRV